MFKKCKILIVEDRVEFRLLIRKMLESIVPEIQIEEAEDGAMAVELAKVKKFDCIFLDYLLGDSTAPVVLKKIKEVQPQIPIVIVSSHNNPSIAESVEPMQIDAFISKTNLTFELLTTTLNRVLSRTQSTTVDQKFSLSFQEFEGMKVIIVDDTPSNITVLRNILSPAKLNISFALDGKTALELVDQISPDLILMDIRMPGIDGFEACRQLKNSPTTQNIPLIFISADNDVEACIKGFSLGAVDYINKPFHEEEVLARVHSHLKLKKLINEKELSITSLGGEIEEQNRTLQSSNVELVRAYELQKERLEDVTQTILEQEYYLKGITKNILDGLITIDSKGKVETFNPAAEKMFGYPSFDVIGKDVKMLIPSSYHSQFDDQLKNYSRTDNSRIIGIRREVVGLRKNGSTFPLDLSVSAMKVHEEVRFIGIMRDISERKQADAEILRFKRVLNSTSNEILVFDAVTYKFIMVNQAGQENLGYTMEELAQMTPLEIKPDITQKKFETLVKPLRQKTTREIVYFSIHKRKDGTTYPVEIHLQILEQEYETVFFAVVQDITERKKSENQLILAKETAEKANRSKSNFLSRMSHEFRTPLNSILGYAQLLLMPRNEMTPTQVKNIQNIFNSGEHLLELINEILDVARIEAEKVDISLQSLPVGELLENVILLAGPLADNQGISLNYIKSELSDRMIVVDKTRIKQVLFNLVSNAIKYNKKNGKVYVELSIVHRTFLRITVRDTGLGIPEDMQGKLFDAFNRLGAEKTKIEGTGIGLNITKKLVELMAGRISFESLKGEGSSFHVEFPLHETKDITDVNTVEATPSIQTAPTSQSSPQKIFHILYIYTENNPGNVELIQQALKIRENLILFTASEANSGIEIALNSDMDIVLIDINLQGMNGIEACQILRNDSRTSNMPILAISANAMEQDVKIAMEAGFTDYISKPINIPQFLEKIDLSLD